MENSRIFGYAFVNSVITALYVVLVALFMNSLEGSSSNSTTVFIPITMLMLFVFSAAFTSSMVFGRPIIWYLDGKKREALSLLLYTLGILMIVTVVFLFSLTLFI